MITELAPYSERLQAALDESAQKISSAIRTQRVNPIFVARAKSFKPDTKQIFVSSLLGELMRGLFLDQKSGFTENDSNDLMHSILGSIYCDYALLDGRWQGAIEMMEKRMQKHHFSIRHAKVFSARNQGIEEFLLGLEVIARIRSIQKRDASAIDKP
jgi:hypothetical protein